MLTFKGYFKYTILLTLGLYFSLLSVNYVVDPAGLNNAVDLGLHKNARYAYRTQKLMELKRLKPNTLLLGGSRVHFLDFNAVSQYTNDSVFNLGVSRSSLTEQYHFLKYALENHDVNNVLFGLNLYTFSDKIRPNTSTDFNEKVFTSEYELNKQLFSLYNGISLIQYFTNLPKEQLFDRGSKTLYSQTRQIGKKSWEKRRDKVLTKYKTIYSEFLEIETKARFEILRDMVELCKKHGVNFKLFTTAVHGSQLELLAELDKTSALQAWKRELATISEFYDFMYLSGITESEDNFIDPSHVKRDVGKFYFEKLFNAESDEYPQDFGVLVNKDNIEQHILSTVISK